MNKYKAKKTKVGDLKFDSKLEAGFYIYLKNNYKILELQPRFILQEGFKKHGKTFRKIEYVADFRIIAKGREYIVDAKGMETKDFKIKVKLYAYKYDIPLLVCKSIKQLNSLI